MKDPQPQRFVAKVGDYKATFESAHGKRVLWDMMKAHYFMSSTFEKDSNLSILREGERNAVMRIMHFLKYTPKQIEEIIKEGDDNV